MRLGTVIREYRIITKQDIRSVASEIGISPPSLMRLEHGRACDAETLMKVFNWLTEKQK